jgi:cholesterol transport system auxiliary component
VGSCAVLAGGNPPPLDTYDLTAPGLVDTGRTSRRQILVPEPVALKPYDGQDIVVRTGPRSIAFLAGAQWADRLPRILQARLAEALQNSNRFAGVGLPGQGLAIDDQILVEVRAFEIRAGETARAHASLFVKLLNDRNGVVRAARLFEASAPVTGDSNGDYARALDAAFQAAAAEIVEWAAARL